MNRRIRKYLVNIASIITYVQCIFHYLAVNLLGYRVRFTFIPSKFLMINNK